MRVGAVLASLAAILILAACAEEDSAPTRESPPATGVAAGEGAVPEASAPGPTVGTATPGIEPERADGTPGVTATTVPTREPPSELPPERTEDDAPGDIAFEDLEIVTLLPYDGIPAILDPAFVSAEEAWYQYASDETVLGLSINGDHRAYSVPYLSSREIVNDVVGGVPVAVTW